ncbi:MULTISPECIES: hypothetical protein [Vagococcus]|uniref:Uncharacterized protein n=1 Tax=Vagococcus fluvialis bH819 TaxID=1255619 RepID=A0A1X6WQ04_9ENTE|nr:MULTISPECIES: hypothetical protein [Vagococcus]SLM86365.1 hypothetical protein FM121_09760 [Vagococcus fluvialis bH819]HCM89019.1 hypothetical protein [Vagococcus sp.]
MSKKISDNNSIKDLGENLEGLKLIEKITKPLGINTGLEISKLEREYTELVNLPDKFNELFVSKGWIAHDLINPEIMKKCINCPDKVDSILISYYEENFDRFFRIAMANTLFIRRQELLTFAKEDYFSGRYYSCIPILLMMSDGMINDIRNTGLFASTTDLELWDSISGHSTGLKALTQILNKSRKKTTTDKLDLPYRNGILHGRDLNYYSKEVAIKSFALIFYIADWARSLRDEENRIEEYQKSQAEDVSLFSVLKKLKQHNKEKKEFEKLQKLWEPRKLNPILENVEEGTPELNAVLFLQYIQNKNYGSPVDFYPQSLFKSVIKNEKAGLLKKQFKNIEINNIEIISIEDSASAVSNVKINVAYDINKIKYTSEIDFRMIYEVDGEVHNRLVPNGKWTIYNIEGIIHQFIPNS